MKTILACGYTHQHDKHPALTVFENKLWVDWQIEKLLELNHEVVIVLGDSFSEKILSHSQLISQCELVFDTNGAVTTLMTNVKSGLYQVNNYSFILPITTPCAHSKVWANLTNHYHKVCDDKLHLVKRFLPQNKNTSGTYPLLITPAGRTFITKQSGLKGLDDQKIQYSVAAASPIPNASVDHL